ncbi:MAG: ABC transporter substrate-binding protein [Treponema sp.]|jgi:polar amino acid transport system substrate-binding protein|nr:ABC transporter substrate-binding protein [Treponema sp.]
MKTIKMYVFLVLCVSLPIGCTKSNNSLTIENGVLCAGIEIGYPPMEYYDTDGTLIGFDIDLTKALAEKLGLRVNFIDTAWDGILAGLDTDRYDIAVNITVLPERQKKYNFTKPYINSFMTIVTRKDSRLKVEKAEDISGYRVSFQGNTTAQYFTERLNNQGVKFTPFSYDKIINCFDDLKLGRVDLVVVDNIVACYYMERENSAFEIAWDNSRDTSEELIAVCLKKGNDALTAMLDNALDELYADGTIAAISYKYFGREIN